MLPWLLLLLIDGRSRTADAVQGAASRRSILLLPTPGSPSHTFLMAKVRTVVHTTSQCNLLHSWDTSWEGEGTTHWCAVTGIRWIGATQRDTQLLLAEADLPAVAHDKYTKSRALSRLVYKSPMNHEELKNFGRRAHTRAPWSLGRDLMALLINFCDALLTDEHVMQTLHAFAPSVVVVDFTTTCGLAVADVLAHNGTGNALVVLSATGFVEPLIAAYTGGPMDPAVIPSFSMPLRHPMTPLERVNNAIAHVAIRYAADWMIRAPSDRLRYICDVQIYAQHHVCYAQAQTRHPRGHPLLPAACLQVADQRAC